MELNEFRFNKEWGSHMKYEEFRKQIEMRIEPKVIRERCNNMSRPSFNKWRKRVQDELQAHSTV
jgi:hypothetical protein